MVRNYTDAITSGDLGHNGDEVFTRHIKNAVRRKQNVYDDDHRQMHTITKDRPDSPRKMDGAMAGGLSWEAAATRSLRMPGRRVRRCTSPAAS
jgi:hypothetical protein